MLLNSVMNQRDPVYYFTPCFLRYVLMLSFQIILNFTRDLIPWRCHDEFSVYNFYFSLFKSLARCYGLRCPLRILWSLQIMNVIKLLSAY